MDFIYYYIYEDTRVLEVLRIHGGVWGLWCVCVLQVFWFQVCGFVGVGIGGWDVGGCQGCALYLLYLYPVSCWTHV